MIASSTEHLKPDMIEMILAHANYIAKHRSSSATDDRDAASERRAIEKINI